MMDMFGMGRMNCEECLLSEMLRRGGMRFGEVKWNFGWMMEELLWELSW